MSAAAPAASPAPLVTLTIVPRGGGAPLLSASVSRAPAARAAEPVDAAPFSFAFTGRHDGGALPAPADCGHYALLLDALGEAKVAADAALTTAMAAKRPRVAGGGGGGGGD